MYCKFCGKEIGNNAYICIHCGAKVGEDYYEKNKNNTHGEANALAIAGLVMAFFIPLLGLIFGCIAYKKAMAAPETDETTLYISQAAIAISVITTLLVLILSIVLPIL